jgi:hypothetical protein
MLCRLALGSNTGRSSQTKLEWLTAVLRCYRAVFERRLSRAYATSATRLDTLTDPFGMETAIGCCRNAA